MGRMNLCCIKCVKVTNDNICNNINIEVGYDKDLKIKLYSYCNDCGFKRFSAIDEEKNK